MEPKRALLKKLTREFYNRDATIVAKELLGKLLVHEFEGKRLSAIIVETEAYMGVSDKAAHSYGGRRTQRVEVMHGDAGYAYVFMVYGKNYCFNTVTREKGNPQAVLIRAVEPVEGVELMAQNRFGKPLKALTKPQEKGLTNGPGKLCEALAINRSMNGVDLCDSEIYIEDNEKPVTDIVETTRVGIDYAEEAKYYNWRFYIKDNKYVSVK